MDESDRERFKKNISERVANGGVVCPVLNCRTNGNRKLNERLQNMKDGNYFMRNKMAFSSFLPRTMDALNCSDCNLKSWNAGATRKERKREKKASGRWRPIVSRYETYYTHTLIPKAVQQFLKRTNDEKKRCSKKEIVILFFFSHSLWPSELGFPFVEVLPVPFRHSCCAVHF